MHRRMLDAAEAAAAASPPLPASCVIGSSYRIVSGDGTTGADKSGDEPPAVAAAAAGDASRLRLLVASESLGSLHVLLADDEAARAADARVADDRAAAAAALSDSALALACTQRNVALRATRETKAQLLEETRRAADEASAQRLGPQHAQAARFREVGRLGSRSFRGDVARTDLASRTRLEMNHCHI